MSDPAAYEEKKRTNFMKKSSNPEEGYTILINNQRISLDKETESLIKNFSKGNLHRSSYMDRHSKYSMDDNRSIISSSKSKKKRNREERIKILKEKKRIIKRKWDEIKKRRPYEYDYNSSSHENQENETSNASCYESLYQQRQRASNTFTKKTETSVSFSASLYLDPRYKGKAKNANPKKSSEKLQKISTLAKQNVKSGKEGSIENSCGVCDSLGSREYDVQKIDVQRELKKMNEKRQLENNPSGFNYRFSAHARQDSYAELRVGSHISDSNQSDQDDPENSSQGSEDTSPARLGRASSIDKGELTQKSILKSQKKMKRLRSSSSMKLIRSPGAILCEKVPVRDVSAKKINPWTCDIEPKKPSRPKKQPSFLAKKIMSFFDNKASTGTIEADRKELALRRHQDRNQNSQNQPQNGQKTEFYQKALKNRSTKKRMNKTTASNSKQISQQMNRYKSLGKENLCSPGRTNTSKGVANAKNGLQSAKNRRKGGPLGSSAHNNQHNNMQHKAKQSKSKSRKKHSKKQSTSSSHLGRTTATTFNSGSIGASKTKPKQSRKQNSLQPDLRFAKPAQGQGPSSQQPKPSGSKGLKRTKTKSRHLLERLSKNTNKGIYNYLKNHNRTKTPSFLISPRNLDQKDQLKITFLSEKKPPHRGSGTHNNSNNHKQPSQRGPLNSLSTKRTITTTTTDTRCKKMGEKGATVKPHHHHSHSKKSKKSKSCSNKSKVRLIRTLQEATAGKLEGKRSCKKLKTWNNCTKNTKTGKLNRKYNSRKFLSLSPKKKLNIYSSHSKAAGGTFSSKKKTKRAPKTENQRRQEEAQELKYQLPQEREKTKYKNRVIGRLTHVLEDTDLDLFTKSQISEMVTNEVDTRNELLRRIEDLELSNQNLIDSNLLLEQKSTEDQKLVKKYSKAMFEAHQSMKSAKNFDLTEKTELLQQLDELKQQNEDLLILNDSVQSELSQMRNKYEAELKKVAELDSRLETMNFGMNSLLNSKIEEFGRLSYRGERSTQSGLNPLSGVVGGSVGVEMQMTSPSAVVPEFLGGSTKLQRNKDLNMNAFENEMLRTFIMSQKEEFNKRESQYLVEIVSLKKVIESLKNGNLDPQSLPNNFSSIKYSLDLQSFNQNEPSQQDQGTLQEESSRAEHGQIKKIEGPEDNSFKTSSPTAENPGEQQISPIRTKKQSNFAITREEKAELERDRRNIQLISSSLEGLGIVANQELIQNLNQKLKDFEVKLNQLKKEKFNDTREIKFLRDENNKIMLQCQALQKDLEYYELNIINSEGGCGPGSGFEKCVAEIEGLGEDDVVDEEDEYMKAMMKSSSEDRLGLDLQKVKKGCSVGFDSRDFQSHHEDYFFETCPNVDEVEDDDVSDDSGVHNTPIMVPMDSFENQFIHC